MGTESSGWWFSRASRSTVLYPLRLGRGSRLWCGLKLEPVLGSSDHEARVSCARVLGGGEGRALSRHHECALAARFVINLSMGRGIIGRGHELEEPDTTGLEG